MNLNELPNSKLNEFSKGKGNWVIDEDSTQSFHSYHSQNLELSNKARVVRRQWGFRGLCFSREPVEPLRPYLIHIDEVEFCWTGHLRVGVTTVNPESKPELDSLASSSQTLLVAFSQISSTVHAGDVVGVYYEVVNNKYVQLHILVNDKDIPVTENLLPYTPNEKVYITVDIFGMTKRITFIPMKQTVTRLSSICEKAIVSTMGHISIENLPLPTKIKSNIASLRSKRHLIPV
ncbi:unnamed protein product [Bursaphelenchus okinawaensis]|uniref:SOCS box domain-containing protein n=1 Tax=Bursaphelenchus okinawaensis TaxID=465554 RepID=A0A811JRX2_9BILA|nr:unnamed protein product [Bursaphelenchus okinawaensis]CAG9080268.1 unnamed protein product [Bursaphelenchus okinawaensis]